MMTSAARLVVGLCLAACVVPPAAAFTSLPAGESGHDAVTAAAAERSGLPEGAHEPLREAVRFPDLDEMEFDPEDGKFLRIDDAERYRPDHHCDRAPGQTDAQAWLATSAYIADRKAEAERLARARNATGAVHELGAALHALEDCFSHSNLVDLPAGVQEEAVLRLSRGEPYLPPGIQVTGFAPDAQEPGRPPGDPYPHDAKAKDLADGEGGLPHNATATKHEAARELATQSATHLLLDVRSAIGPERWEHLGKAETDKQPDSLLVPAPLAAPALLGAAMLLRRRSR